MLAGSLATGPGAEAKRAHQTSFFLGWKGLFSCCDRFVGDGEWRVVWGGWWVVWGGGGYSARAGERP
jgi:hypothetical protein